MSKKNNVKILCNNIRKNILFAAFNAGAKSAHIGGALSIVEILSVLFEQIMNFDYQNPFLENRDRFILSKGHACLALYSVLAEKGFFEKSELKNFESSESFLLGHPVMSRDKGIEFSTGSLGMGLSLGIGLSKAAILKKLKSKIFVLLGDGECNEGSVWESALLASHLNLENLTVIIDRNNHQQTGTSSEILNLNDLTLKWQSFGFQVLEVDGHNIDDLFYAFKEKNNTNKPKAIIAKTIKGKGFSFTENNNDWHHTVLTKKNYDLALSEIDRNKE